MEVQTNKLDFQFQFLYSRAMALALLYYKKFGLSLYKNLLLVRTCDVFLHLVAISLLGCIPLCFLIFWRALLVLTLRMKNLI